MSQGNGFGEGGTSPLALQARLTSAFVVRQLVLLAVIGTLFLALVSLYNFYNAWDGDDFWQLGNVSFKYFELPVIIVLVFGYVLLIGVLFAFVPSEHSFNIFFYGVALGLVLVNYDHTVLDWLVRAVFRGDLRVPELVSVLKIAIACPLIGAVIYMHYNILSDDFTKRMIRRGIPTEEIAKIRPGMLKSLLPLLTVCAFITVGLGLVGEFSELVFQHRGLFPKVEILFLGGIGVAIAYLLRSIIRELYQGPSKDDDEAEEENVDELLPAND